MPAYIVALKPTGVSDSTIVISPSKAKELNVKEDSVIALVGRRRRATFARVSVSKQKKSVCTLSANLASNLRLRKDDKVKVVPLSKSYQEEDQHSGDVVLLDAKEAPKIMSLTLSPIEDSLQALEAGEGGDEIPDEEIQQRFVAPYLEDAGALIKKGHVLTLRDEMGKKLEFMVTGVALEGEETKEEGKEGTSALFGSLCVFSC
mgnify:CR=1 FL=1